MQCHLAKRKIQHPAPILVATRAANAVMPAMHACLSLILSGAGASAHMATLQAMNETLYSQFLLQSELCVTWHG